jgi:septal ring factor EnvC (AmiA/AmiB activator)
VSLFRRSKGVRPKKLVARINELTEQLQRERIESANRFAALEARLSALEDELLQLGDVRSEHREELAQIARALSSHHAVIDSLRG